MANKTQLDSVLVLGAGKIGSTVADMLAQHHSQLRITLADQFDPSGQDDRQVRRIKLDAARPDDLCTALSGHDAVINCLPYFMAQPVAAMATTCGSHYFDLTEDVAATEAIRRMAVNASAVLMPQCGLAPGVVGMLGWELACRFDTLYDLRLRVGALTRHATNSLRYNFTWSIDGVINEYCNPADAIVNGERVKVQPLEGHETFTLDAEAFEAFNTAGGLGTLCESLQGRVRNLDYKSIRYPGHREAMNFLLHDLRLVERRDLLRQVLELAVPHSRDDVVILFAAASGLREGRFEQETCLARIYGASLRGKARTAIELSTAAGVVGALELLQQGKLPAQGFVRQEQVTLQDFLRTRVGHHYAQLAGRAPLPAEREAEPA
ncbi:saccharopine dehydrogenase family protein [Variovorax sp. OV329]|uniref:saccharopine dehydrogenase family protein n=1 Tax=Variovorax sp. OV329 TaxID=1882825 RepID=UPI0008F03A6B|nr:saccharopine dehydrogenase C-terminal domain-containing protein [Variovorax sp. OV329]SFL90455.1 Saccharopine dehydrogenase, NADP-dependent [Variovorax sp. OV329]